MAVGREGKTGNVTISPREHTLVHAHRVPHVCINSIAKYTESMRLHIHTHLTTPLPFPQFLSPTFPEK